MIFSIYLLGIVLSILTGRLFRSTLLRGADAPFVMELPPYRVPMFKSLTIHMWDRSNMFLRKMGGVILIGSVVVWTLSTFPTNIEYSFDYDKAERQLIAAYNERIAAADKGEQQQLTAQKTKAMAELAHRERFEKAEKSYMGRIGKAIAPVFEPLGIDWRASVALLTGFVAKEIVVSTLGVLYAIGEKNEGEVLKRALKESGMSPLSAFAMMVFVLLYVPCLATITTIRQETGSTAWMLFSIGYSTGLAWLMAFVVYQGGRLFGLG